MESGTRKGRALDKSVSVPWPFSMEVRVMIIREKMEVNITDPACAAVVIKEILRDESKIDQEKEHFWTIGLNTQNKVKFIDLVSLGSVNHANVIQREAFRLAVLKGCSAVVFAHNHPSGSSLPSAEDFAITRTLTQAGLILGIKVLDHVIVGEDYYSFNSMNRLQEAVSMEKRVDTFEFEMMELQRRIKALSRRMKKCEALQQSAS
jgi:DNA repair protein RadC